MTRSKQTIISTSVRNRTCSGGPGSTTGWLSATLCSFHSLWNDVPFPTAVCHSPLLHANKADCRQCPHQVHHTGWVGGFPPSAHSEVACFLCSDNVSKCLSKGTNSLWVFKRIKKYQDLRNLNGITLFQLLFYDLPNFPLCLPTLGNFV